MTKITTGILAHVDAGKTTLSESLLYLSGSIRKIGRVDTKDAFLDTYDLEKERGITIFSKQAELMLDEQPMTLLDTPGHVDFSAEMERTLQVLDYAILVISGADGVQGHTRTLWQLLSQYKIPTFIFVNKMDQHGTDEQVLMREIQQKLGENCLNFCDAPAILYEEIAMCDEQVMEHYLDTAEVSVAEIQMLIQKRIIFPCFFGSALKLTGVETFLAGLKQYMVPSVYPASFGANVFKISRDAQGKRLTYMKITGGSLKVRTELTGERHTDEEDESQGEKEWREKVNQIRIYNGVKYENVEEAPAGTVCAVTGLNYTQAGEGLGAAAGAMMPVLEPVLTYRIELPDGTDVHKVLGQLRQIEEEEPALHIVWEAAIQELHAQLMGEIQTEVLVRLIKERFDVDVHFGAGRILYKETIAAPVEGVGHFEPLRHYAEVHLLMEPDEPGSGLTFETDCSENLLSRNWQRLILTHLEERVHRGVLTGAPITDMRVTLIAGRAHLKHTEGGDFRQATYRAVRQGLMKAESVLLEPFYAFRLEIPRDVLGRAMTDMEMLCAKFELAEGDDAEAVLTGTAPVSTMREYQKAVAAYTSGKGKLFCTMAGYYPCHNAEAVIEASGYDPERDLYQPTGSVFCAHGAGFVVPWYEVERYMHLTGAGLFNETAELETPDVVAAPVRRSSPAPVVDEDELAAIFKRTYGERKPANTQRERVIKAPAPAPVSEMADARPKHRQKRESDRYLLVDGYNIIFAWPELNELAKHSMDAARSHLMEVLSNYQGFTDCHVVLVFDAYRVEGFPGELMRWHNIDVVFTKEAETADQYIEKTAHVIGHKYHVTVATSDGVEQVIIRSKGCFLLSARELKEEIERVKTIIREEHLSQQMKVGNYLFDYLPESETARMEAIRRGITVDSPDGDEEV